jgi:hypothetical protein
MQALFLYRSPQAALLIEQYGPGNWSGLGSFISPIESMSFGDGMIHQIIVWILVKLNVWNKLKRITA